MDKHTVVGRMDEWSVCAAREWWDVEDDEVYQLILQLIEKHFETPDIPKLLSKTS